MGAIKTIADLQAFVALQEPESLLLDYKRSEALDFTEEKRRVEFSKDLAAFANSAGGRIIYGVDEGTFSLDAGSPVAGRVTRERDYCK